MSEEQPTPAHLFGELVINTCYQVLRWDAARLQSRRAADPPLEMPEAAVRLFPMMAEKLLEDAETIGVDTAAVWEAFGRALQKGREAAV